MVATACGCSKSTVSRAISGKGRISDEQKDRILEYCRLVGYRTDVIAQKQYPHTRNIVVVLPQDQELSEMPFFFNCIMGICESAQKTGYCVMLMTGDRGEVQNLQVILEQKKADGVILLRVRVRDLMIEYLQGQELPFLVIGNSQKYSVQYVDNDTERACEALTIYLLQKNMSKMALIGGNKEHIVTWKRLNGFQAGYAICDRKVNRNQIYLDCNTKEIVYEVTERILQSSVDCIVCMDDRICYQVLEKLHKMNVTVGQDIEVASFYDSRFLRGYSDAITTLRFDEKTLGKMACEKMISRIEKGIYESKVFTGYRIIPKNQMKKKRRRQE